MSQSRVVLAIEHNESLKRAEIVFVRDGLVIHRIPAGAYFRRRAVNQDWFVAATSRL